MSGAGKNPQSQLLAEIEEFSRNGPLVDSAPAKPELHRETLAFPDLNKAPVSREKPKPAVSASPTLEAPSTLGAASADSLLARLKQQAQSLQQDASQRDAAAEANAQALSASIGAAFHYLDDLVKQLNIIKPAIPREFVFPGNIVFSGMSWVEGAADFRMVPGATENRRYESLTARFRIAAPRTLTVDREALGVEPLRKMLHDYGVVFTMEEKLNARNQAERARFLIPCEIKAGFIIKADYEAGNLLLRTRNVERFGMMEFRLNAADLNQETLDELTKLFLGEQNRFLQMYRRTA
ncbi:MAG: hypothetical protein AB1642_12305 [Pseudomonadota bacterium]